MTTEQIKIEQAKVDTIDCKSYAKELCCDETNIKELIKIIIAFDNKTVDEIIDKKIWFYW